MGFEDNPADDVQPTKEEWEAYEVREAARRIVQAMKDSNDHDGGYPATDEGRRQSIHDHATVAHAWLREHLMWPISPAPVSNPPSEEREGG